MNLEHSINTDYTLSITEGEERYIVRSSDTYYSVNKFAYSLLYELKEKPGVFEISESLEKLFPDMIVNPEMIMKLLSSAELNKILYPGKPTKESKDNNYIWFKRNIVSPEKITWLLAALGICFKKGIYKWLFLISAITTMVTFLNLFLFKDKIFHFVINTLSVFDLIVVLFASLFITFIHEIGHAVAAYKNGITSKLIGFGLYFVMPVFFTELTDIWILPKFKRVQINLAGIYFQLLLNIPLMAVFYTTATYPLLGILFLINTVSALGSLNPFFRYDFYWVLSDLLNIPNLREKSTNMSWNLLKCSYLRNFKSILKNHSNRFLVTYSILNFLFWLFVYFNLVEYSITTIKQLASLSGDIRSVGISLICNSIILLLIITRVVYKPLKRFYEYSTI